MKNLILSSAVIFAVLGASGCGKDAAKKAAEDAANSTADAATLAADPESASSLVSTQVDDAVTSIAAGDAASGVIALADSTNLAGTMSRTRTCSDTTNANSATVTMEYSGSKSNGDEKSHMVTATRSGSEIRVWSKANTTIKCKEAKSADIDWKSVSALNNLKLSVTTKRVDALTHTFTKKDVTKTFGRSATDDGTRTITFAATDTTKSKSIVSKITKTLTVTKKDGKTQDLSSSVEIKSDMPLTVTTSRDLTSGKAASHTIVSGKIYSLGKKTGSFYVVTSFSNLMYDLSLTAKDACIPKSGSVTTMIYKSDAEADMKTPLKTYVSTYTDSVVAVTVDGTASTDATESMDAASNKSCEFKEDSAG